jgi:hypothetical protein
MPDAIFDLHELPASSSKPSYQENFLETVGSSKLLPEDLYRTTGVLSQEMAKWLRTYDYDVNVYYDGPGSNLSLCHRHFGLRREFPAFLCEAKRGSGRDLQERVGFHLVSILRVADRLMESQAAAAAAQAPVVTAVAGEPPQPREPVVPEQLTLELEIGPLAAGQEGREIRVAVVGGEDFESVLLKLNGRNWGLSIDREEVWSVPPPAGSEQTITVTAYGAGRVPLAQEEVVLGPELTEALPAR